MDCLQKWETYWRWVCEIRSELRKNHSPGDACVMSRVPYMNIIEDEGKHFIRVVCRTCTAEDTKVPISKDQLQAARWFSLISAWCREWNFHLKALIDLEKNTRATELEISVRGLEEIVYRQLKPDYNERKGDVPPPKGASILYIHNPPNGTTKIDLEDEFKKYGRILSITVEEKLASIEFEDHRDTVDALRDLNEIITARSRTSSCEGSSTKE